MEEISNMYLEPLVRSKYLDPKWVHFMQNGIHKRKECIKEHSDVAILIFNKSRQKLVLVKQFRPAVYVCNAKTEKMNGKETVDLLKYPGHLGVTIELCSGIVDRDEPLENIAQAEVLEECGYAITIDSLRKITSFRHRKAYMHLHKRAGFNTIMQPVRVIPFMMVAGCNASIPIDKDRALHDKDGRKVKLVSATMRRSRNGVEATGAQVTLFYTEVSDDQRVGPGGGLAHEGEHIEVMELSVEEAKRLIYDEDVNREATLLCALHWFLDTVYRT